MIKKIIVLGGGMVGSAIARDLKENGHSVTVADRDIGVQNRIMQFDIKFVKLDFSDFNSVHKTVQQFDFVIGAVPGFLGYRILQTVLEAKKDIVDISFMPEDPRGLNKIAVENGVTAITDAGVAPGLSNLMFGNALSEFDKLDSAKCFVGGLPQNPKPPWWYKSVFSPIDVVEEYTRPARLVENGQIVTKPAMTEIEPVEFENIATLDAFNSDGLRTLLDLPIPNMVEKTMRFQGHIQKIIEMKNQGLFEDDKIKETSESLIQDWKPEKDDYDQTIMRLEFRGIKDNKQITDTTDLIDYFDREKGISSMARTTGYTCTAVADLLISEKFTSKGVFAMESLGKNRNLVDSVLNHLSVRNVILLKRQDIETK
ncbi:MAG: saccharopine dehydrogenase NADP-binding domain-containing protein [Candidatus Marinimicrobia bacterium]|nr:saccharopine dehydrogenase NADP-binding domain-containing protein [Candidatus Neomarinimicrobiota bacterium]MBL7023443.1 saccharopine dehydrogenase NADP-binding domain-containing protein [Candidatus Neomarinimicrobiota bacterium]MBL7108808.1 saccharopine dehydrogenase NADP-binding domain-containing protein [Candidatus Neomarinimicrobiota bacterium]